MRAKTVDMLAAMKGQWRATLLPGVSQPSVPPPCYHCRWFDDEKHRLFDVFALYYGNQTDEFRCDECVGIFRRGGAKWRLFYLLSQTPVWERLMKMYTYIGVPDDDLIMSTHGIEGGNGEGSGQTVCV